MELGRTSVVEKELVIFEIQMSTLQRLLLMCIKALRIVWKWWKAAIQACSFHVVLPRWFLAPSQ